MSLFKKIFNVKTWFSIAVIIVLLFQYFQLSAINNSVEYFDAKQSSMITEIGQLKGTYSTFGEDLNEVRKFLLLPTKAYVTLEDESSAQTTDQSDKNTNELQLSLFKYTSHLGAENKLEKDLTGTTNLFNSLVNSETFKTSLSALDLHPTDVASDGDNLSLNVLDLENTLILSVFVDRENAQLKISSPLEDLSFSTLDSLKLEKEILSYLENNIEKIKETAKKRATTLNQVEEAVKSDAIKTALSENGLVISEKTERDMSAYYAITNEEKEIVGQVIIDLKTFEITLQSATDDMEKLIITDVSVSLPPFIKNLNKSTVLERKVIEAKETLKSTIEDKGFQAMLKENGLVMEGISKEDENRIFYNLSDNQGNIISIVVIEKRTGVVNITDKDGNNSENILFFDPEDKKKTLILPDNIPEYGDELSHGDSTFNILLAGKHGNLMDTMIFAHIDEVRREVRMISIPRDLYYNGRKINSFAYFYGLPELKKVLSELSGYKLDKFVLIDMYAFIDVIDIIGGIDITLKNAVIDPTYRTVDNGVTGTLHYEPGDYHLGGKEALRLARTRHTSSDFARAERQQMIIKAIQQKARNFGFGDADTFYEIAKTVLSKVETDVSLKEAVAYYFKYQGFEIVSNNVMSSGNVLYSPPYVTTEQCNSRIAAAEQSGQPIPDCMNANKAYMLLPKNDNWNIIKWYFKENFEPKETASEIAAS